MKPLTSRQLEDYNRDGYIVLKRFFSKPEVDKLYSTALEDDAMRKNALDLNDQTGKKTKLSLWFTPGNDVFGYMTRSRRMIEAIRPLLDSNAPVCHFHSKLMQKEPRVGGAWEWHQDYGYWYKNQFMFPDQLISVMVALTEANKENGCLQIIKSSHKLGRVNHGFAGEQVGADMVMVNNALKTMPLIYCELDPGDALIFHSNLYIVQKQICQTNQGGPLFPAIVLNLTWLTTRPPKPGKYRLTLYLTRPSSNGKQNHYPKPTS